MDIVAVNYTNKQQPTSLFIRNATSVESATLIAYRYWSNTPKQLIRLYGVSGEVRGTDY